MSFGLIGGLWSSQIHCSSWHLWTLQSEEVMRPCALLHAHKVAVVVSSGKPVTVCAPPGDYNARSLSILKKSGHYGHIFTQGYLRHGYGATLAVAYEVADVIRGCVHAADLIHWHPLPPNRHPCMPAVHRRHSKLYKQHCTRLGACAAQHPDDALPRCRGWL